LALRHTPVKENPMGPVKTFDETDVIQSSNTWEFLLFEQIRSIRLMQTNIFAEPRMVRFKILDLIVCVNHLESLMYDRINPTRDGTNWRWKEFQSRKPDIFKKLDFNNDVIRNLVNSNEFDQLKLIVMIEKWFIALDKYMTALKKVEVTSFEMEMPDPDSVDIQQPGPEEQLL